MSRRFRYGGKRYSLGYMHSSFGTAEFKSSNPNKQKAWSSWDARRSRNNMKRMIKKSK